MQVTDFEQDVFCFCFLHGLYRVPIDFMLTKLTKLKHHTRLPNTC